MALPIVRLQLNQQIFSPFSGLPADGETGINEKDQTLLFVHYGDSGEFAFVNDRIASLVDAGGNALNLESLVSKLSISGGLILEIDTGWNGLNTYGFAPNN